ncbi:radical SAM protein [Candidatus Woesearchaeota archaeon]|nr:radical SAM protein [Candidatus Woesearchaeota archaeon]
MEEERLLASWHMTNFCNFNCHYCYCNTKEGIEKELPVDKIINSLKKTGRDCNLNMTGGEPFLFPNFIELCKALTENDIKISIDTNLSIDSKVKEFINTINPVDVKYLYISTHIEEREKRNGVDKFIENLLLLKEKNFHFGVNYVLHPTLFKRFKKDYDYFESKGIKLNVKPFKGLYNGKKYPLSYTNKEKKVLLKNDPGVFRNLPFDSKGVKCNAGKTMVRIQINGDVSRCVADKTKMGNIFMEIKLNEDAKPCIVDRCPCFGVKLIQDPKKIEEIKKGFSEEKKSFISKISDFVLDFLSK